MSLFFWIEGCGKSTMIALLLRFYDVDSGAIYLDDVDIRLLNIAWLRSKFGLVSQEPVLFNASIYENICFGDNVREQIEMSEVIEVAKQANIHDKISTMPNVSTHLKQPQTPCHMISCWLHQRNTRRWWGQKAAN